MVSSDTFVRDTLYFLKNDLLTNITDPLVGVRDSKSSFIMTSYPQRPVQYPLITIKPTNFTANRSAMQSNNMDMQMIIEVRVWARNQKEKDQLFELVFSRLRKIQFATNGTQSNNLHDFKQSSAVDVDEDGDGTPKSRVMEVVYKFYDFT